jgi:hypothetical protein
MNTIQQAAEQIYKPDMMIGHTNAIELYTDIVTHYQNYLSQQGDDEILNSIVDYFFGDPECSISDCISKALAIGRQQGDGLTKACKDLLHLNTIDMEGMTRVSPNRWYEAFNKLSDIIYP